MSSYKEGQVHLLMEALERKGWTGEDLTLLGQFGDRNILRPILYGDASVAYLLDLSKPPKLPFLGASVLKHEVGEIGPIELCSDNLYIGGKKVEIFLSEGQNEVGGIYGHKLREELEGGSRALLNSNLLDYLYKYPELYPEHWKQNEQGGQLDITSWGSLFQGGESQVFVRFMYWRNGKPCTGHHCLKSNFNRFKRSACLET